MLRQSKSQNRLVWWRVLALICSVVLSSAAGQSPVDLPIQHWKRLPFGTTATGSVYVPLDNWVYQAFDRLIAWGYIDSAFTTMRPWTRLRCVQMLQGAEDRFEETHVDSEARSVFDALRTEFERDYIAATRDHPSPHAELDSLYERSLGIAGTPLNDSFHFGQSLINDYGRPFQQGFNQIAGFSARAEFGRFSLSVGGEYQYAPGRGPYSAQAQQAIAVMDNNPPTITGSVPETNVFRLLDANLSVDLAGNQISVGKSAVQWGPGEGGAFAISDNAEPFYKLRITRVKPVVIPFISRVLGPMQYDLFLGPLEGHVSPRSPWIQGQNITFKPSVNFEFGVSRTIVFAGEGHVPLTVGSFWNSFASFSNVPEAVKFSRNDPGARYSTFDFTYRIPFVRNWLTVYCDAIAHDDVSPLSAPRRSGFRPGIFLAKIPGTTGLDFRAEAVYTDFPTSRSHGGQFFFYESAYHDAYVNKQFVLGDWIGRESKGGQAWLTYHRSPQEMIQITYRNAKAASDFVPGGTTQNAIGLNLVERLHQHIELDIFSQLEFWKAPILARGLQNDVALGLMFRWFPKLGR